jgi:uncharacterized membrane protein
MSSHDMNSFLIIFCVALGTYSLRYFGLIFSSRFLQEGRVKVFLDFLPPTILLSLVAPAIFKEGMLGIIAALCIAISIYTSKNILISMSIGILVVALGRNYL